MFCPECGKGLEEGKSFCKYCGANVAAALAANQAPPPAPPPAPPTPPTAPPPPAQSAPPPFAPPPSAQAPPPFQPPYQQPPAASPPPFQQQPPSTPPPFAAAQPPPFQPPPQFQPQFQPPVQPKAPRAPSGGEPRPRWVMPFLLTMAAVVVLSLIGLVVVMVTAGGGSSKRDDPPSSVTSTVAITTDDTTVTSSPNTDDGSSTTATVPGYDPGNTVTTAGGQQTAVADYVAALDDLEATLTFADGQMPGLADQINNTAPAVPTGVSRDLQRLHDDVSEALDSLALIDPPEQYRAADDLVFEASNEMLYRIEQTLDGIDAMWAQNKVSAAKPYFDAGREARDAFRSLFKEYKAARP